MTDLFDTLLPRPTTVRPKGASVRVGRDLRIEGTEDEMARSRILASVAARDVAGGDTLTICFTDDASLAAEAYRLSIDENAATIRAGDRAGRFYGAGTLAQLLRGAERDGAALLVPAVEIEDAPAFAERGVMLDVSRNRIPTMETLYALVDRFAGWKLNRLQLYTEHTFAFRDHEAVWAGWDPLTAEEIRALDAYCRERCVELVPNQQSFGHLHHWFRHDRYRDLAEVPEGVQHPFTLETTEREPFSLCPTDPRALAFLAELYDELLPCFSSQTFNVGLDETFDLGEGRSAEARREKGTGRVYVDFLRAVHGLVAERGHTMQFWADILLQHPDLVAELPRDTRPMLWGYEAEHPFETETATVAAADLTFSVCPGTSTWQSLGGRTGNMLGNVTSAATHGHANGAHGLLVTDWGDRGHLQPLPVSYPGWAAAAAVAWNPGAESLTTDAGRKGLAARLDLHAFDNAPNETGFGEALLALGEVGEATGVPHPNASALFRLLIDLDGGLSEHLAKLDAHRITQAQTQLAAVRAQLDQATAPSDGLVRAELDWAADGLDLACRLGIARVKAGADAPLSAIPEAERKRLALELTPMIDRLRRLWLARCRAGGLDASVAWLTRLATRLRA